MRYKVLDLFCGAGGAAMGLHRAGFEVVGVDIVEQPNYPFDFIHADALEVELDGYDAYWASPPCQAYSIGTATWRVHKGYRYPDLIAPIRARLMETGKPYVIENVVGAPLHPTLMLCGLMFGLKVLRHRLFETSFPVEQPPHPEHPTVPLSEVGMYTVAGHMRGSLAEWQEAMGIDWMTKEEMVEAVPPAYAEYIGRQLIAYLRGEHPQRTLVEEVGKHIYAHKAQ